MQTCKRQDGRITWHQRVGLDAVAGERFGEGAGHIRQTTGLDQRIDFRCHGQHMQWHARRELAARPKLFLVAVIGFPHPLNELRPAQRQ